MARFVAKAAAYTHGAVDGHSQHIDFKGDIVPAQKPVIANFQYSLVTQEDFVAATTSRLVFTGLPMYEDTEQDLSPRSRLSVWDSEWAAKHEGWRPDEIEAIIKALRESPENGIDFIEVEEAKAAKPWPTYDEFEDAEEIGVLVNQLGLDPAVVIAYEEQNQNRETVLDELRNAKAEAGEALVIDAS